MARHALARGRVAAQDTRRADRPNVAVPVRDGRADGALQGRSGAARRRRAALIAGALAAAALEAAKHGFGWYLAQVSTYEVVYGALAALPIFLLWIYLCWIIILAGAAVSATIADPGGRRARRQTRATD